MHNKNKFFFAAVLFSIAAFSFAPRVHASTQVSADITASTEWTLDGSPYVLTKQIVVQTGITLTIDPGVSVAMDPSFTPPSSTDDAGILVLGGVLKADGTSTAKIDASDVFVELSSGASMDMANADLGSLASYSSTATLSSMTLKSIWLYGSTATASGVALLGDAVRESGIDESKLTMQNSTIDSVNPDLASLTIGNGAKATLNNTVVRSLSTGIYLKGFGILATNNVLIEDCPVAGIEMKRIDSGTGSFDNEIYLVSTEIAGNHYGIEAANWPNFQMAGDSIHDNDEGFHYDAPAPFTVSVMHMLNNWWGDASGPYNAKNNPAGKGNSIADLTTFSPWLTAAPFPSAYVKNTTSTDITDTTTTDTTSTDTSGGDTSTGTDGTTTTTTTTTTDDQNSSSTDDDSSQTQTTTTQTPSHTPVLIVPGVLGTEMNDSSGNKLWLDLTHILTDIGISDHFMDSLAFKTDLTPSDPGIVIGDILGKELTIGNTSFYDYSSALIQQFESEGYIEGKDLFVFPYDWRYGVSEGTVNQLKSKIEAIQAETGSAKIDIVAHSTGGLIVKKYIFENASNPGIEKAVFVGVPNTGAPKAIKTLVQGDNFGVPLLPDSEMKMLAQNFPVVYDLAPSAAYYANKGSYYQVIKLGLLGTTVQNLDQEDTNNRLLSEYHANQTALDDAANLHTTSFDNYDLRTAGIDLYAIDGCKTGTFGGVAEAYAPDALGGGLLGFSDVQEIPGDGTVPLESATNLPINDANKYYALEADHGSMLSQDGIRQEIVNIISGSTLSVSSSLITQDITQCHLNGQAISIYSPLSIDITDANGDHAGLSSDGVSIEDTIPNADYEIFGDHKFVYLPTDEGQTYTISVAGTGTGGFTLTDAPIQNDAVTGMQVFSQIPVTPSLKGSLTIGPAPTLSLDTDGDGTTDETLEPSETLDAADAQDFYPAAEETVASDTSGTSETDVSTSTTGTIDTSQNSSRSTVIPIPPASPVAQPAPVSVPAPANPPAQDVPSAPSAPQSQEGDPAAYSDAVAPDPARSAVQPVSSQAHPDSAEQNLAASAVGGDQMDYRFLFKFILFLMAVIFIVKLLFKL